MGGLCHFSVMTVAESWGTWGAAAGGETDVKVDTSVNREHLTVFKWVLSQHTTEPQNMWPVCCQT